MISGFADRRLWPLGYAREKVEGTTGLEPARNSLKGCLLDRFAFVPICWYAWKDSNLHDLFLRQVPLPIWATRTWMNVVRAAGFEPANTCFPGQARIAVCGTLWFVMASGKGFEPLFTGSEPAVLPIRRPRNDMEEHHPQVAGGKLDGRDGRTRTCNLLVRSEML